jgi:hypothetical protein
MASLKTRRRNFSTEWFVEGEAVTADEKDKLIQMLNSAAPTLELLAKILAKRKTRLDVKSDYDSNWTYEVPKDLGRKEELVYLLKLLTPAIEQE